MQLLVKDYTEQDFLQDSHLCVPGSRILNAGACLLCVIQKNASILIFKAKRMLTMSAIYTRYPVRLVGSTQSYAMRFYNIAEVQKQLPRSSIGPYDRVVTYS